MNYKLIPIFLLLICIILFNASRHSSKEGFESYNNCIEQGYPMDFCIKTPIQSKVDGLVETTKHASILDNSGVYQEGKVETTDNNLFGGMTISSF